MNMTILGTAMFLSFAAAIGFCAWMAVRGEAPAAIVLAIIVILFFGNIRLTQSDVATCPKCGHTFEAKPSPKK